MQIEVPVFYYPYTFAPFWQMEVTLKIKIFDFF